MKKLIVVDCQNDFISGTLACENAEKAVKNIVKLINTNKVKPLYSMDWHSNKNKSFKVNGGIWPVHCVKKEEGSKLHESFYNDIEADKHKPNSKNKFKKGRDDEIEEYSAFLAKNNKGQTIADKAKDTVIVAGIASEYCVRETVLALLNAGVNVELFEDGIAWVNKEAHLKNINELEKLGVKIKTLQDFI